MSTPFEQAVVRELIKANLGPRRIAEIRAVLEQAARRLKAS